MFDYILDACAVLALLKDEEGAQIVRELLKRASDGEVSLCMNATNLIEVYYDCIRTIGFERADAAIRSIYDTFPVSIIEALDSAIVREAAYFKVGGKMSFADAILMSTARCTGATVVSCDHAELDPVEQLEHIPFLWIRPQF